MKHNQSCRCGSTVEVEDDDRDHVRTVVAEWRSHHRCLPVDERDNGRSGVGFAAAQVVRPPSNPLGHIEQDVRA